MLTSNDPVTAVFESAVANNQYEAPPKNLVIRDRPHSNAAEKFWEEHIDIGDFAESWKQYETV